MKPCCAVCGNETDVTVMRPLGRNDALVPVCTACDTEPATTKEGPFLGFVPSGGLLSPQESLAGARKAMGAEAYARESELEERIGRIPSPRLSDEETMWVNYMQENKRRVRTRAAHQRSTRSSRDKKLF